MISWKKSLNQLETLERLHGAALGSYIAALRSNVRHAVPAGQRCTEQHQIALTNLRKHVENDPSEDVLTHSAEALDEELKAYSEKVGDHYRRRERDIRAILELLRDAAKTIQHRNTGQTDKFLEFAHQLESISELDDLGQMRRRLAYDVRTLREYVHQVSAEGAATAKSLEDQLATFQRRLHEAEEIAATDDLTGLANRREAERRLDMKIREGGTFCIIFFDLNRFKLVNDRFGHQVGDEVLRAFAKRLIPRVRVGDTAARWGGDEFVVVVNCDLRNAIARAKEIAGYVCGVYSLNVCGMDCKVNVTASFGVAEYRTGESRADLFRRADALLYAEKEVSRAS
jgi:diguanylate cyclase (GGDEF)-like protein